MECLLLNLLVMDYNKYTSRSRCNSDSVFEIENPKCQPIHFEQINTDIQQSVDFYI